MKKFFITSTLFNSVFGTVVPDKHLTAVTNSATEKIKNKQVIHL